MKSRLSCYSGLCVIKSNLKFLNAAYYWGLIQRPVIAWFYLTRPDFEQTDKTKR